MQAFLEAKIPTKWPKLNFLSEMILYMNTVVVQLLPLILCRVELI